MNLFFLTDTLDKPTSRKRAKIILLIGVIIISAVAGFSIYLSSTQPQDISLTWWKVQSIDTMKYSRDLSREKLHDASFDQAIVRQIQNIASTGVTHVAIGTPYDDEFLPILTRWVQAARDNDLKVWFRGNWSGWEEWFDYPAIDTSTHLEKTVKFIKKNGDLFEQGDLFDPCPECENGSIGDPRRTGDVAAHRSFLIEEYAAVKEAFQSIGTSVTTVFSISYDVAILVMDEDTTRALGGIVAVDHYVSSPQKLKKDILALADFSNGRIYLSEFGAPIPDIHGSMTQKEQAAWLQDVLVNLIEIPQLQGINYWVGVGGSTALWSDAGEATPAVRTISYYYTPKTLTGRVTKQFNLPAKEANVSEQYKNTYTDEKGYFYLPYFDSISTITVESDGYVQSQIDIGDPSDIVRIRLQKNE